MARAGVVDFGDQIFLALRLLRERPYVLAHYQRRFRYILVDEFQDTNHAQFELVKLLAGAAPEPHGRGRRRPGIYRFRGASMRNILGFDAAYPGRPAGGADRELPLGRSAILDAAYRLIRHNDPERLEAGPRDRQAPPRAPAPPRAGGPMHARYETVDPGGRRRRPERSRRRSRPGGARYRRLRDPRARQRRRRPVPPRRSTCAGSRGRFSGNQGLYDAPGGAALHRVPPGRSRARTTR